MELSPTPGFVTAKIAVLIDKYHLSIREIAGLTDYQIVTLYFHKRDEDGVIKFPEQVTAAPDRPATEAECLMVLAQMKPAMKVEDYEEAVQKVRAKFKEADEPEPD